MLKVLQRLRFVLFLSVGGLWQMGCFLGGAAAGSEVSIMAWNVQNLFDGIDDGTEYREFDPGEGYWDERLYQRRLDRTKEIILASASGGPDILVFSEIENKRVLMDLHRGPLKPYGYDFFAASPGEGAVRTGVLSRFPILRVESYQTGWWEERPLRPLFFVELDVEGYNIQLIAVHWKSPRDGLEATEPARYQEAVTAAQMILSLLKREPDAELILLGDLNTEGNGLVEPAALAPWPPQEEAHPAGLYRTTRQEDAGIHGKDLVLFDPDPDSLLGPPGTYYWHGKWERPDRALLAPGLLDEEGFRFINCFVPAFDLMRNPYGEPWRWITSNEDGYSDHAPLLLTFRR